MYQVPNNTAVIVINSHVIVESLMYICFLEARDNFPKQEHPITCKDKPFTCYIQLGSVYPSNTEGQPSYDKS